MPRPLVFDLDDTLLDATRRVSEDFRTWPFVLREDGIETTLASGRPYASLRRFIRELGLRIPLIVFNRAVIVSPDGDTQWTRPLARGVAKEAIRLLDGLPVANHLYLHPGDSAFYTEQIGEAAAYIKEKDGIDARVVESLDGLLDDQNADPVKLFIIGSRAELEQVQAVFRAVAPEYTCVFSEYDVLEFPGAGVTMGAALRALCGKMDVPLARAAAFGDNPNDDPAMIRVARLGVSMAAAPDALKREADTTTDNLAGFLRSRFWDTLRMEEQYE